MADKSVTIKSATDKQLDELLNRLRKENEIQNLIADLKRKSDGSDYSYRPQISTEEPIESLYHFGVLGMKWGRRKGRHTNRVGLTPARQHEYDKAGLKALKEGKTVPYMLTQKRREAATQAEIKRLEGRIEKYNHSKKEKFEASKDHIESRKLKAKGAEHLSTQELRDLTQRLQLEKQYRDLNPKKLAKGIQVVKNITAAGTTVASLYALSKTPLGQDIIKAISKAG